MAKRTHEQMEDFLEISEVSSPAGEQLFFCDCRPAFSAVFVLLLVGSVSLHTTSSSLSSNLHFILHDMSHYTRGCM